jgi:hypothetical protein
MSEKGKSIKINRTRRVILNVLPFIPAALVFLCIKFADRKSELVETYYSEGLYPHFAKWLSSLSNLFPFSLWDLFLTISVLLIIIGIILVVFRKLKLGWYGLRVAQYVALLYSVFYIVWGFNYFRPPIETRLGWTKTNADINVFRSILDSVIVQTNLSYDSVSVSDYSAINELIEESFLRNSGKLGIQYPNGTRRPKPMIFSSFIAKVGISGYFGPFFSEVHLNSSLLPMDYAFSLAHEKSHQFGISNEAEANLVAFMVCTTSDDKRLKYSGNLFLLLYFLDDASHLNDYHDYVKKIDRQVIKDLHYRRIYYERLDNKTLDNAQSAVYNTYLKANHIEEGVKNYNQVVALVISWYQNRLK